MAQWDRDTFISRLQQHHDWLEHDLKGAKLCVHDDALKGFDLQGADLQGADLWRANLAGTDFRRADIRNTILYDAVLTDADLRGTLIGHATFRDSDMTRTKITMGMLQSPSVDLTLAKNLDKIRVFDDEKELDRDAVAALVAEHKSNRQKPSLENASWDGP